MKIRVSKILAYVAVGFIFLTMSIVPTSASVLQIITPETAPDWDETSAIQSGLVGSIPVTITTTNLNWNPTFINDHNAYSRTDYFGSLAQPLGTTGDFVNQVLNPGDIFTITITLGGSLLNPTIYVTDIDTVGAWVNFPSGGTAFTVNADGSFTGDTMTVLSGAPATSGAFGAVQYTGLFPEDTVFALNFNFDVDSTISQENVGLGLAAVDIPTNSVPEPATMLLLGSGLIGLVGFRRKKLFKA